MNKICTVLLSLMIGLSSFAQTPANPFPKTISVSGSAEMEVVPDEIFVQVNLKEYEKRGQSKTSIDKIKQDFLNKVKAIGLADSLVTISDYDGEDNNPWQQKKRKKEELFASISYQLKLKTSKQMDDLVNTLDDDATDNFRILRMSHSKASEFRKQLKIQAIKAAKEKAKYLTEAIDEKLGEAVSIDESDERAFPVYTVSQARGNNTFNENTSITSEGTSDFRKIKYRYEVSVDFALK